MSEKFRRGLVVGKFSPLHRGHEQVLTAALQRCERVYCLSYSDPELPGCGAPARRHWMAELFPTVRHLALDKATLDAARAEHPVLPELPKNTDSDRIHRTFVAQICLRLFGTPVDAVFTSEAYGDGFAQQLERDFRAAGHSDISVTHVPVDPDRRAIPISASALRENRSLHRAFLSPVVYGSFVRRICVLGGESSGKTTLTRRLAQVFETAYVDEYGRELWIERGGNLNYADYLSIARTQVTSEDVIARSARDLLFCDTSPLTTLLYCLDQFGKAEPELHALAARPYHLTVLAAPDFPFTQDGTRRSPDFTARQHELYQRELDVRRIPYLLVEGPVESRVRQVQRAL